MITETITIRVPSETKKALDELAKKDDRSINYYIGQVISKHLKSIKVKQ